FQTLPSTASSPGDFAAVSLVGLSLPAGQTSMQVLVPVHGDTTPEKHENLLVQLSAVSGASPGRLDGAGRIVNDDGVVLASICQRLECLAGWDSATPALSQDGRYLAFAST